MVGTDVGSIAVSCRKKQALNKAYKAGLQNRFSDEKRCQLFGRSVAVGAVVGRAKISC